MNIIWTLITMSFAYGIFVVFIPLRLISLNLKWAVLNIGSFNCFGLIFLILGIGINSKCYLDLIFIGRGTPDPSLPTTVLVVKGIYKYVRNPVYIGFFFILFGEAILFKTALLLIYSFLWLLVFNLIVVFIEEPSLRQRFGESYINYIETVPRWIPRLRIHRDD